MTLCREMPVNTVSRIIGEDDNKLWRMVRYHIMKILGKAVDDVRKEAIKEQDILRGAKYLWLKNRENFTVTQEETLKAIESMPHRNLKTVRALHIRENFQHIYKEPTPVGFERMLKKWRFRATNSRIEPIIAAAKTIKTHWSGILRLVCEWNQ